jgi:hypothetical protein
MSQLVGDALFELVEQLVIESSPRWTKAVEWLREHAVPPQGLRLTSPDGTAYSGLLVVQDNDVVVILAARHPGPVPHHAPIQVPTRQPNRYLDDDPDGNPDGWPPDNFLTRR